MKYRENNDRTPFKKSYSEEGIDTNVVPFIPKNKEGIDVENFFVFGINGRAWLLDVPEPTTQYKREWQKLNIICSSS